MKAIKIYPKNGKALFFENVESFELAFGYLQIAKNIESRKTIITIIIESIIGYQVFESSEDMMYCEPI